MFSSVRRGLNACACATASSNDAKSRTRELLRDRLPTRRRDGRHDVDDDQRAHALGCGRGEGDRVQPAEAQPTSVAVGQPRSSRTRVDVGDEVVAPVARRPVGVAVAALVEREDVVVAREVGRHLVPAVRGLRAAVEQGDGRRRRRVPQSR